MSSVFGGASSLDSNWVSVANSTSTPIQSFVGSWVNAVQYNSLRVSCASDVNGTIAIEYSADGINVNESSADAVTGAVGYFRAFAIQNYCGQFISDDFVNPRRVSLNQIDMQIPFLLRNRILHFSMEGHLPNGRNISYYTIDQLFTFLIQAWTDYMKNIIGDSTFFATV